MKLWLIKQGKNNGYDTYDSAVVASETKDGARRIHPSPEYGYKYDNGDWAAFEFVEAELIGEAIEGTEEGKVICASFNAG